MRLAPNVEGFSPQKMHRWPQLRSDTSTPSPRPAEIRLSARPPSGRLSSFLTERTVARRSEPGACSTRVSPRAPSADGGAVRPIGADHALRTPARKADGHLGGIPGRFQPVDGRDHGVVEFPEMVQLARPRSGHFDLGTGYHGDLWLELHALLLRPPLLRAHVRWLAERLREHWSTRYAGLWMEVRSWPTPSPICSGLPSWPAIGRPARRPGITCPRCRAGLAAGGWASWTTRSMLVRPSRPAWRRCAAGARCRSPWPRWCRWARRARWSRRACACLSTRPARYRAGHGLPNGARCAPKVPRTRTLCPGTSLPRYLAEGRWEPARSGFEAELARSETETGPGLGELATLADHIHALGRELQVIADFGDSWRRVA